MSDHANGDGSSPNFDRKLDRINDTIANLTDLVLLQYQKAQQQHQLAEKRHELVMAEIRELLALQREQRVDIMALFQSAKQTRERIERLEPGDGIADK